MGSALAIGLIIASAAAGAFLYRIRGGMEPALPRPAELGLWSALITAPAWALLPWWAAGIAFACAFGATSLGHGSGMDMGHSHLDDPNELLRQYWAPEDNALHDTLYMVVNGALMTIAMGVLLAVFVSPWLAVVALAGALKGPAYRLAWALYDLGFRPKHARGAELGEWLTGGAVAGACAGLWLMVI